jgi:hypothetical protein
MTIAYSVIADGLGQTPVFASPLDRGRFFKQFPIRKLILFPVCNSLLEKAMRGTPSLLTSVRAIGIVNFVFSYINRKDFVQQTFYCIA